MIWQKNLYDLIDSIGNLGEINIALNLLKSGVFERWALKHCIYNHSGASVRIPMADILIKILTIFGLVEVRQKKNKELISLSQLGKEFLEFEYIETDRLTKKQGIFLLSKIIGKTAVLYDIFLVIKIFNISNNGDLWISSKDKRIDLLEDRVLRLLQQLKIAYYKEGNIIIYKQDKEWLKDVVFTKFQVTEDDFLELLEQKRMYGIIAEEFVESIEKRRLINLGREDLAKLVTRVTEQNVAAGYDILSFDGKKSTSSPDRFIEVKGNSSDELLFYISKNELETAKRMNNKYWIYCVLNVKSLNPKRLITIKNPYRNIFQLKKFKVEPVLWKCMSSNLNLY